MKTVVLLLVLVFCVCSAYAQKKGGSSNEGKITICHVPPGNPLKAVKISISLNAWKVKNALSTSSAEYDQCIKEKGDFSSPEKHAHCPGGHGGDYIIGEDEECLSKKDKPRVIAACEAASRAAKSLGITKEKEVVNGCDDGSSKKISICHVPPGRPDKAIPISISCNAWKTCKSGDQNSDNGFHCPGGHGGDFAQSSCGIPVGSEFYETVCKSKKTICAWDPVSRVAETRIINALEWEDDSSANCDTEYGPSCGDREGECPKTSCGSLAQASWPNGVAPGQDYQCSCVPNTYGTCVGHDCNCVYCFPETTCNGLGTCKFDGTCDCGSNQPDALLGCKTPYVPPNPSTCTANLFGALSNKYSGFQVITGNADLKRGDIEGTAFVLDTFRVSDFSVGKGDGSTDKCNGGPACRLGEVVDLGINPKVPTALYVGGSLQGDVSICSGLFVSATALGINSKVTITSGCINVASNLYSDFPSLFGNFRGLSKKLCSFLNKVKVTALKTINLPVTNSAYQAFSIDGCGINSVSNVNIQGSLPADATVVINVCDCDNIKLDGVGFSNEIRGMPNSILWNFGTAKKITIDDTELPGTVLAPQATLTLKSGGSIKGQVISKALRGTGQYKNAPFTGCLKDINVVDADGKCLNTCPNGAEPNDFCECPCTTTCTGGNVLDTASCTCYCPIVDCPYGQGPDSSCSQCVDCDPNGGETILARGSCAVAPKASCSNPKNIFGEASDYSVFILKGDFKSKNNRVGGRIAVAGDVSLTNFLVGDDVDAPCKSSGFPVTIAAKGTLNVLNGQVLGGSVSASTYNLAAGVTSTFSNKCGITDTSKVDISFDSRDFEGLSDKLKDLSGSKVVQGKVEKKKNDANVMVFTGKSGSDKDARVEVFHLSSSDAQKALAAGFWELNNVDAGATIVVNIGGGTKALGGAVGFSNLDMSAWKAWSTRTVFNFYEADTVVITGVAVQGSILAPYAIVDAENGQVQGQIIAAHWVEDGSIYVPWNGGFRGCVDV